MVDAVKGSVKEVKDEQGSLTATGAKASFYLVPQATDGISFTLTLGGETKHFTWMLYLSSRVIRRLHWKVANRAL